jgi:hypothetical protein
MNTCLQHLSALAIALGGFCTLAAAQDPGAHVGMIKDNLTLRAVPANGTFSVNGGSFPARDKTICIALGNQVAHVLLQSPLIQPPHGFDLNIGMSVGGDDIDEYERPGCSLTAIAIGYNLNERGVIVSDGEGPASNIRINQPSMIVERFFLTGDASDERDANGDYLKSPQRFFLEPKPTASIGKYSSYGNWTAIPRHDAPPLVVPATRSQYLGWQRDWLNRQIAADQAEQRKLQAFAAAAKIPDQSGDLVKMVASLQSELKKVNATLAALSPADRSTPAWCRKSTNPEASLADRYLDTPAGSNGAQPLFVANPNYLDRTRDSTAQLILIDLTSSNSGRQANTSKGVDSQERLEQLEQSWIELLPKLEIVVNQ